MRKARAVNERQAETTMRNRKRRQFLDLMSSAAANALASFIICYCVVSFFAGQAGLLAYRDLAARISEMEENVVSLKNENVRLTELRQSHANDPDRIAREAREIGYLRPGEKILILPSALRFAEEKVAYRRSEPLRMGASTGLPDQLVKLLAALSALAVFFASLMMQLSPLKEMPKIRTSEGRS